MALDEPKLATTAPTPTLCELLAHHCTARHRAGSGRFICKLLRTAVLRRVHPLRVTLRPSERLQSDFPLRMGVDPPAGLRKQTYTISLSDVVLAAQAGRAPTLLEHLPLEPTMIRTMSVVPFSLRTVRIVK